jgi:hypothetical protein
VFFFTGKVRTAKPAVVLPAGTTIHAGGCAAFGILLATLTPSPPSGAGAFRVRVAAESWPPFTYDGLNANEARVTLATSNLAVTVFAPAIVTEQ